MRFVCQFKGKNKNYLKTGSQKGVAAILLVLLTGISATVLTFGVVSHIKGSQKSQLAVHGQTQAEINAWASVEALGQFINGNTVANATLTNYTFTAVNGSKRIGTATYVQGCSNPNQDLYCYQVTGNSAGNNSTLEVVYNIPITSQSNPTNPEYAMVFKGDLVVNGGGFDIDMPTGKDIAVDGKLTISNASKSKISGCAVDDISVNGGGVDPDSYLHSSTGDITLTGLNADNLSVWGGNITIDGGTGKYDYIKAVNDLTATSVGGFTANYIWADNFDSKPGGIFTKVLVNTDVKLGKSISKFDEFTGGGDMVVASKDHIPTFTKPSTLAGEVTAANTGVVIPFSDTPNLTKAPVSPGLPDRPVCNVKVRKFDVNTLISSANYVFYYDETTNDPMLKIQNVNNSSGLSVDGIYNLNSYDETSSALPQFKCTWPIACYSDLDGKNWKFGAIDSIPPGIYFFGGRGDPKHNQLADASLTIDGIKPGSKSLPIVGTFLSTGSMTLGNAAGTTEKEKGLAAPYFSTPKIVCGGDFYPTNLCDSNGAGHKKFKTIIDAKGTEKPAEILANSAIMVNDNLSTSGWTTKGHVVVGGSFKTDANKVRITGYLMVGINYDKGEKDSYINQGGMDMDLMHLTDDQRGVQLGNSTDATATGSSNMGQPRLDWARYL
ncbi:MAG: hypothetical protein P8X74_22365 [Reinekea sp.]